MRRKVEIKHLYNETSEIETASTNISIYFNIKVTQLTNNMSTKHSPTKTCTTLIFRCFIYRTTGIHQVGHKLGGGRSCLGEEQLWGRSAGHSISYPSLAGLKLDCKLNGYSWGEFLKCISFGVGNSSWPLLISCLCFSSRAPKHFGAAVPAQVAFWGWKLF